ncbi:MAG TPA: response regulator transcription factor [Egibacteraceae bacterium]|nr:response regulator transcription factor [Egibacteraceae bacterium]
MEHTRVLIADDHAAFRHGLRALLTGEPDLEVVGEAHDGHHVLDQAVALQPDVVLMDLDMPGGGVEATRRLTAASPHVRVLVLTMYEDDVSVYAALQSGARGYVLKGARKTELVRAIRAVASGELIVGPTVASRVLRRLGEAGHTDALAAFPMLTDREREVLSLLAGHLTNPEIAARLRLSDKTVRNHVSNIFAKLGVATRTEAVTRARDAGLVGP